MKDFESGLTADRLREVLAYCSLTGAFHWRVTCSVRRPVGSLAGDKKKDSGYTLIGIDSVRYRARRLAWLYVHGEWPCLQVDHIDGNRSNNAISNLRQATQRQNSANMRRRSSNLCGVRGVRKYCGNNGFISWRAHLSVDGKSIHLGAFSTAEEAKAAYDTAASVHFGDFARVA